MFCFSCRVRISITVAALVIMAVVTTVVNLLVIVVFSTANRLRNSQSTYKLSLAVADLLVGTVVLPSCIYNLTEFLWQRLTTSKANMVAGYEKFNGTYILTEKSVSTNIHENLLEDDFPLSYLNGIGFVTAVSIFVSIYTLAAAGVDRFFAVYKPLSYNKEKAGMYAKVACAFSWTLALVISVVPIVTPPNLLTFGIAFSMLVAALRPLGIIAYAILLFIPLIVVWVVNILIYIIIKRHSRTFQRKLSKVSRAKADEVEKRLATTLRLMGGVFTFNTLPLWLTLLSNLFVFDVRPQIPETLNIPKATTFITIQVVSVFLLLGNSLCNFFIYNARNEDFRKALKQLIKALLKRAGFVACWKATRKLFRNTIGLGSRKFSTMSFSIFNIQKKSGTTEEMVIEKIPSTSQFQQTKVIERSENQRIQ